MHLSVIKMTLFKLHVAEKGPKKLGSFLLKNSFSKRAINNAKNHNGMILVNHKRRYTSYHLQVGDEVLFLTGEEKKNPWLSPSNAPVNIVQEKKNYLIVNKPAGVLSIPSRYEDDDALVNRLMGYFKREKEIDLKPHVITRLDRNTSGLVLIGKNAVAHARFSKLGKDDFVKKYHAIVHGNFSDHNLTGVIELPIGKKGKGVKRNVLMNGKKAKTTYKVLKQKKGASLVELRLYTGRTHQIRVHMQYIGHPLFGDKLYGIGDKFPHQALNCFYLAFPDPFAEGRNVRVKISDPEDMQLLWNNLES